MIAVGLHLMQDARRDDAPGQSAVATLTPDMRLSGLAMCRTDAEIVAAIGDPPALVLMDAPAVVPDVRGRRDSEHVLAWLDIPAFPVTPARMASVHGGTRGAGIAAALTARGHVVAEALPDQVLRQLMWEKQRPRGTAPIDLGEYRAEWLGVRAPAYRPRGGRARPDGLAPARGILQAVVGAANWPPATRDGDLAALDEAAVIDAVACGVAAARCLHGPDDSWAMLGDAAAGRVVLAAGPEMIERARVNIARLRDEGTIGIPPEVAAAALGPPQSW